MRWHRHQVSTASHWHSVRMHHPDVWDWCAHHEEVERHVHERRRLALLRLRRESRTQAAA